MQHHTDEAERKHFPELTRRSGIYGTMTREQLAHRLEVLEGFILGTTGEPAPLIGVPGEEEADFLEDGAISAPLSEPDFVSVTPEDEESIKGGAYGASHSASRKLAGEDRRARKMPETSSGRC